MNNSQSKTINGFFWSFVDIFSNQGVTFLLGVILARLLSPFDFGLIGMITFFITLSESLINSGFSNALIRKQDCTNKDFSTVFYFNITISVFLYFILVAFSNNISIFFNEPQLSKIINVLGVIIVIDAFSLIHKTILIKNVDFKLQSYISLTSSIASGIIALIFAYYGFGVWSLVILKLSSKLITTILFWKLLSWYPEKHFSVSSFTSLFGFGSKLLLSGIIETIYSNIYYVLIGRYFSAYNLGLYTRAQTLANIPTDGLTTLVSRVSLPILSSINNDNDLLRSKFRRILCSIMFITTVTLIVLASMAKLIILCLIGTKWISSVVFFQLLCLAGILYPMHALNLNLLQVVGRSDLILRIEIIKKLIGVPIIILALPYGIKILIVALIINSFVSFVINSYYSNRLINYGTVKQLIDILPTILFSIFIGFINYLFGEIIPFSLYIKFFIQLLFTILIILTFSEIFRLNPYLFLKNIFRNYLTQFKNKN